MRKKSFTLLEIMVVVVIVGILATLGVPFYQNIVENSKSTICEEHLKVLKTAMDIYAMENDTMPASLSRLPQEYIKRAYVSRLGQKDAWKIKLADFILNLKERGLAYAEPFLNILTRGDISLLTCPRDPSPPAQGGISYGVYADLGDTNGDGKGMSSQEYRDLIPGTALIGDSDSAIFTNSSELIFRHNRYGILTSERYALSIQKNGEIVKVESVTPMTPPPTQGQPSCLEQVRACMANLGNCVTCIYYPSGAHCQSCAAECEPVPGTCL